MSWKAIAEFAQVRREAAETKRSLSELDRQIKKNNAEEAASAAATARNQQRLIQIREQAIRQSVAYRESALAASKADDNAQRAVTRLNSSLNEEKRRLDEAGRSSRLSAQGAKDLAREKQRLDSISRNLRNSMIQETAASTNLQRASNKVATAERDVRAALVDRETAMRRVSQATRDYGAVSTQARSAVTDLRAAEDRLREATAESERTATRASNAEERLNQVRSRVAQGTRDVTNSLSRLRDEERAAVANGSLLGRILLLIGNNSGTAGGAVRQLAGGLRLIAAPIGLAALLVGIQQLIVFLGQAVGAAFAFVSAIGPVFASAAALPTIIGALGSAFAAVKLGTSGIGAALQAYSTGQNQAATATGTTTKAMGQQQSNARAVAQALHNLAQARQQEGLAAQQAYDSIHGAEESLASAQYQATQAQQALTQARIDARVNIDQLRQSVTDEALAERGASLSLAEARANLARTLADPGSTALERAQAKLAVDEAKNNLSKTRDESKKTRKEYKDASKAGVEGSQRVRDAKHGELIANQQLADAQRALAEAQQAAARSQRAAAYAVQQAILNLADAHRQQGQAAVQAGSAGSSAMDAFQQKMAGLTPAQRQIVRQLIAMRDKFKEVKNAAAAGLAPGLSSGLKAASGLIPILVVGMRQVASAVGDVIARIGRLTQTSGFRENLAKLFSGSVPIIHQVGLVLAHLLSIFVSLAVQAQPFTRWIGRVVAGWTQMYDAESKASERTGRLRDYLNNVVKPTLQVIGAILHNTGSALLSMGHAARHSGDDMLHSLRDLTKRWADWSKSVKGQHDLREYFDNARQSMISAGHAISAVWGWLNRLATALKPGVVDIFKNLGQALRNLGIDGAGGALVIFVGLIDDLSKALLFLSGIPGMAGFLKVLIVSFATLTALKWASTVTGISAAARALAALRSGVAAEGAGGITKLFAKWRQSVPEGGTLFGTLATKIKGALGSLARPFRALGTQIGLIPTRLGLARLKIQEFGSRAAGSLRNFGSKVASAMSSGASAVGRFAKALASGTKQLALWIVQGAKFLIQQTIAKAKIVATTIATIAQTIAQKIAAVAAKVWAAAQWLLNLAMEANPIILIVTGIIALAAAFIYAYKHSQTFRDIIADIGRVFSYLWSNIIKPIIALWLKQFTLLWAGIQKAWDIGKKVFGDIVDGFQAVVDFFIDAWHKITGTFSAAWNWVKGFFQEHWKLILGILTFPLGGFLVYLASKFWGPIKSAFSDAWNWVKTTFGNLWDGLKDIFEAPIDWFHDHIGGWFDNIKNAFTSAIGKVKSAIQIAWSSITKYFGEPVYLVVKYVYTDGIKKVWDNTAGQIGLPDLPSIDASKIPHFAEGGTVPGYAPGQDRVPALLSPGESVLVPQVTRELGGDTIRRWNRNRSVQRFAGGGLVGDLGNLASGLGGTFGKIASALNPERLWNWVKSKWDALQNIISKAKDQIGSTKWAAAVLKIPETLIEKIPGFLKDKVIDYAKSLIPRISLHGATVPGVGSVNVGGTVRGGLVGTSVGPQATWNALRRTRLPDVQSAGVMGNIQYESGFNPLIIQGGGTSLNPADAGPYGYGLVQWTPGSKLVPYLHGNPPSTGSEIAALLLQLAGRGPSPESEAGRSLMGARTPYEAGINFGLAYERYSGGVQTGRGTAAEYWYHRFHRPGAGGGPSHAMASGGGVPGSGNRDTVPAMLTPGEFVIRKRAAERIGMGNLRALNAVGYHAGGPVGQYHPGGGAADGMRALKWQLGLSGALQSARWTPGLGSSVRAGHFPHFHDTSMKMAERLLRLVKKYPHSGYNRLTGLADWPRFRAEEVFARFRGWFVLHMARSTKSVLEGLAKSGKDRGRWVRVQLNDKDKPILQDGKKDLYRRTRHTTVPVGAPWSPRNPLHDAWSALEGNRHDVSGVMKDLQNRMNMKRSGSWYGQMDLPVKHLLSHGIGKTHPWNWPHPWSGPVTAAEQAIAEESRANQLQAEWNKYLTQFAEWGLTDLVQWLEDKGVADGMGIARTAAKSRSAASTLNAQIKKNNSLTGTITTPEGVSFDRTMILKAIGTIAAGTAANPAGIRTLATSLQVPDYVVVNMFDTLIKQIGTSIGDRKLTKLRNDVTLFRQGLFYAASGGGVPGSGTGDSVPAMLTPGEFVVRRDAAKAIGPEGLQRLNHFDALQHFALGGFVAPRFMTSPPGLGRGGQAGVAGDAPLPNVTFDIDVHNPTVTDLTYSVTKALQLKSATGQFNRLPQEVRAMSADVGAGS